MFPGICILVFAAGFVGWDMWYRFGWPVWAFFFFFVLSGLAFIAYGLRRKRRF